MVSIESYAFGCPVGTNIFHTTTIMPILAAGSLRHVLSMRPPVCGLKRRAVRGEYINVNLFEPLTI